MVLLSKHMKQELINDSTALGGLPLLVTIILLFFFISKKVFYSYVLAFVIIIIISWSIRMIWPRERPEKRGYKNILQKYDAASFPSVHAARAGVHSSLLSLYFQSAQITVLLIVLLLLVCYSRVKLKKHHLSDVLAGAILGVTTSGIVYWLL